MIVWNKKTAAGFLRRLISKVKVILFAATQTPVVLVFVGGRAAAIGAARYEYEKAF